MEGHANLRGVSISSRDMDEWIRVAAIGDLPPEGSGFAVKADGIGIALFRREGRIHAIEDLCPHLGFPLSEGILLQGEIVCGWHGWRICLEDGSCRREKARAKVFACEVQGEEIFVYI